MPTPPSFRLRTWPGDKRSQVYDYATVAVLFLAALAYYISDANSFAKDWTKSSFYERYYGIAVLGACQDRWESPAPGHSQVLAEFLAQERLELRCEDLPPNLPARAHINYMAISAHYLFKSVEMVWRITGKVSWESLDFLLGLFFATVTGASYLVFRLGAGRGVSLVATALFLAVHISWVHHFRDYSKAAFLLVSVALLGSLVAKSTLSLRRLLFTCGALGIVLGVGMGFRPDVMILVPVVVLTIIFFLPWTLRSKWRLRVLALLAFVVFFQLVRWPATQTEARRFGSSHVALLGLDDQFNERLNLERPPYLWTEVYSDPYAGFMVKSYSRYTLGRPDVVPIYSVEYATMSSALYREIMLKTPADFLQRGLAAAAEILRIPWITLALLASLAAVSLRQGLFAISLFFLITTYTAVQFHPRHYFHVEWLSLWVAAFGVSSLLALALHALRLRRRGAIRPPSDFDRGTLLRFAAVFGAALIGLLLPLALLRTHQSRGVEAWLAELESAETVPLETTAEAVADDVVRLVPEPFLQPLPSMPAYRFEAGHLALRLDPSRCGSEHMEVTVRYESGAYHDFSHPLRVSGDGPKLFFVPVYSRVRVSFGNSRFLGLEVSPEMVDCLSVARVRDLERFPPIPHVGLSSRWRELPLYERYQGPPGLRLYRAWLRKQVRKWEKILGLV